jgi:hypothetical protein
MPQQERNPREPQNPQQQPNRPRPEDPGVGRETERPEREMPVQNPERGGQPD